MYSAVLFQNHSIILNMKINLYYYLYLFYFLLKCLTSTLGHPVYRTSECGKQVIKRNTMEKGNYISTLLEMPTED